MARSTPTSTWATWGTHSDDNQATVEELLLKPAREWPAGAFAVAGTRCPDAGAWPANALHIEHLPPGAHRHFYNAQRYTLSVARRETIRAGWSPDIRRGE